MSVTAVIDRNTAKTITTRLRRLNTAYKRKLTGTLTISDGTLHAWLTYGSQLIGRLTLTDQTSGETTTPIKLPASQLAAMLTGKRGQNPTIMITDTMITVNGQTITGTPDSRQYQLPTPDTPGIQVNATGFQEAVTFGTLSPHTHQRKTASQHPLLRAHEHEP